MTEKYEAISQHCMQSLASPAYHQLLLFLVSKSDNLEELDLLEEMVEQESKSVESLGISPYKAAQLMLNGHLGITLDMGSDYEYMGGDSGVCFDLAEDLYLGDYEEVLIGLERIRDNILFGE